VMCYGSLRQGCGNDHLLLNSTFIGNGRLVKFGSMYSAGSFPILTLPSSASHTIVVEVYHVNSETLARLDRLEGYPFLYTRTQEEAKMENGETLVGWIYHQDSSQGDFSSKLIVESGDWAMHLKNKSL